jgi:hypothetical protein
MKRSIVTGTLTVVGLGAMALMGRSTLAFAAAAPEPYSPGLGDFMTAYVQPHHLKLWFAGIAGNWKLAAYEASELDETFDDVVAYQSNWHDLPIGQLVKTLVRPQIKRVSAAIAAKDVAQFKSAYGDLSAACNRCHASAQHDFIQIVTPSANPYADQNLGTPGAEVPR